MTRVIEFIFQNIGSLRICQIYRKKANIMKHKWCRDITVNQFQLWVTAQGGGAKKESQKAESLEDSSWWERGRTRTRSSEDDSDRKRSWPAPLLMKEGEGERQCRLEPTPS